MPYVLEQTNSTVWKYDHVAWLTKTFGKDYAAKEKTNCTYEGIYCIFYRSSLYQLLSEIRSLQKLNSDDLNHDRFIYLYKNHWFFDHDLDPASVLELSGDFR